MKSARSAFHHISHLNLTDAVGNVVAHNINDFHLDDHGAALQLKQFNKIKDMVEVKNCKTPRCHIKRNALKSGDHKCVNTMRLS